jgi:hypothetical protein
MIVLLAVLELVPVPAKTCARQRPFGEFDAAADTLGAAPHAVVLMSFEPQKQLKTPSPAFVQSAASEADVAAGLDVPVAPAVPACGEPRTQFSVSRQGCTSEAVVKSPHSSPVKPIAVLSMQSEFAMHS